MPTYLKYPLTGVWILALVVVTSIGVRLAAEQGLLIWAAPIVATIPIAGLAFLQPKAELVGWAIFTVWLGSTYAAYGSIELVVFGVITALALFGLFASPWLLVLAWFGHIAWDFAPRELPPLLTDLPHACIIFDGLIGTFIAWRILKGRWKSA